MLQHIQQMAANYGYGRHYNRCKAHVTLMWLADCIKPLAALPFLSFPFFSFKSSFIDNPIVQACMHPSCCAHTSIDWVANIICWCQLENKKPFWWDVVKLHVTLEQFSGNHGIPTQPFYFMKVRDKTLLWKAYCVATFFIKCKGTVYSLFVLIADNKKKGKK